LEDSEESELGFADDNKKIKYSFMSALDKATAKMVDESKKSKAFDDIIDDKG